MKNNSEINKNITDLKKNKVGLLVSIRDVEKMVEATGTLYLEAFEVALIA